MTIRFDSGVIKYCGAMPQYIPQHIEIKDSIRAHGMGIIWPENEEYEETIVVRSLDSGTGLLS